MTDDTETYRCGCFVTGTGEQCTRESDHEGAHRFAGEREDTEEVKVLRNLIGYADRAGGHEDADRGLEIVREMERDAIELAAWQHAADTRWRQLTAFRERVAERLLSIDTLARNVEEYPDRVPMLIEAIEKLQRENYSGRLAQISGDGALPDKWTQGASI
jgi:hypothetical protein